MGNCALTPGAGGTAINRQSTTARLWTGNGLSILQTTWVKETPDCRRSCASSLCVTHLHGKSGIVEKRSGQTQFKAKIGEEGLKRLRPAMEGVEKKSAQPSRSRLFQISKGPVTQPGMPRYRNSMDTGKYQEFISCVICGGWCPQEFFFR